MTGTTRPWAFDNNQPWATFRELLEREGLSIRPHSAWRVEDGRTRGDNMQKFVVYGLEDADGMRPLVGMILVEGFGPDGFALWHLSEHSKSLEDVAVLRRRADVRAQEIAICERRAG